MSDDQKTGRSIDQLLEQVIDKTNGQITYANTLSVRVGENEVILEFYFMLPPLPDTIPQPTLLQRVVLPLKLGMQLADILSKGIAQIEPHTHAPSQHE